MVVVGGGFGGLPACRYLASAPVDVTLLDRRNHHLFQPLLYQVATGILSPGQIAPAAASRAARSRPTSASSSPRSWASTSSAASSHATRFPGEPFDVPYDSLIVAGGAGQSYFGHDEFALFAPGMKTIDDALELRRRIFGAFEMAETATDPEERRQWLTIAVVGAGPTGVEIAGQVRELALRSLRDDFRSFDPTSVRVILLDAGKEPVASFGHDLSGHAARQLGQLGVELRMGARVTGIDLTGVDVESGDGHEHVGGAHRGLGGRRPGLAARGDARPRRPEPTSTDRGGSRSSPTSRFRGTRRCSPSAT